MELRKYITEGQTGRHEGPALGHGYMSLSRIGDLLSESDASVLCWVGLKAETLEEPRPLRGDLKMLVLDEMWRELKTSDQLLFWRDDDPNGRRTLAWVPVFSSDAT